MLSAIFLLVREEGERRGTLAKHSPGLLKKILLHIGGVSLILIGIVGLFLPVLQGVLLILAGLSLLSMGNQGVRRWIESLEKRYPRQALIFKRIKAKVLPWRKPRHQSSIEGSKKGAKNGG